MSVAKSRVLRVTERESQLITALRKTSVEDAIFSMQRTKHLLNTYYPDDMMVSVLDSYLGKNIISTPDDLAERGVIDILTFERVCAHIENGDNLIIVGQQSNNLDILKSVFMESNFKDAQSVYVNHEKDSKELVQLTSLKGFKSSLTDPSPTCDMLSYSAGEETPIHFINENASTTQGMVNMLLLNVQGLTTITLLDDVDCLKSFKHQSFSSLLPTKLVKSGIGMRYVVLEENAHGVYKLSFYTKELNLAKSLLFV